MNHPLLIQRRITLNSAFAAFISRGRGRRPVNLASTAGPRSGRLEAFTALAVLFSACSACRAAEAPTASPPPSPSVSGPYFGQKPPGRTPQMFAPGIISQTNRLVDHVAFSPDGNECFFSVWGANFSSARIYWTKCVDNTWTPQVEAPFSVGHYATGASFSKDGSRLYFGCGKPDPGIWMVRRTAQGWSDPQRLASPANSTDHNYSYSETADGVSYFASNRPGGQGTTNLNDLWRTRRAPGGALEAENLGATVNSTAADFDPCIAPDGSYLIFTSERPGGIGGSDLYVTFPTGNDGWTAPVNLNTYCPGINVAGYANVGPTLSPEGRYLFFTRYTQTATGEQEDVWWVENPLRELAAAQIAKVTGPYFGQTSPGRTPQIFAPGILSRTDRMEARIAFSPDGNECFFTVPNDFTFSNVQLYYTKRVNDVWSPQALAPFAQPGFSYAQPFFSADGNRLYFTSNKDGTGGIWSVERTAQVWGNPQILPSPLNSPAGAGEYSQTKDGTAYIESGGPGGVSVWRARPVPPGQSLQVEKLGPPINSSAYDSDPFVAPDGRYLIFSSNRSGGLGGADLYVAFDDGNGIWSPPVNLNQYCPGINTDAIEYGASLSPDGRFLFFVRLNPNTRQCDVWWVENPVSDQARGILPILKSSYLGQPPPTHAAEVFAPGIVSLPRGEGEYAERPVFSADFRECFFDVTNYKTKTFTSYSMRCEQGVWSKPEPAFFTRDEGGTGNVHWISTSAFRPPNN